MKKEENEETESLFKHYSRKNCIIECAINHQLNVNIHINLVKTFLASEASTINFLKSC